VCFCTPDCPKKTRISFKFNCNLERAPRIIKLFEFRTDRRQTVYKIFSKEILIYRVGQSHTYTVHKRCLYGRGMIKCTLIHSVNIQL